MNLVHEKHKGHSHSLFTIQPWLTCLTIPAFSLFHTLSQVFLLATVQTFKMVPFATHFLITPEPHNALALIQHPPSHTTDSTRKLLVSKFPSIHFLVRFFLLFLFPGQSLFNTFLFSLNLFNFFLLFHPFTFVGFQSSLRISTVFLGGSFLSFLSEENH